MEQRRLHPGSQMRRGCWEGGPGWVGCRKLNMGWEVGIGLLDSEKKKKDVCKGEGCSEPAKATVLGVHVPRP